MNNVLNALSEAKLIELHFHSNGEYYNLEEPSLIFLIAAPNDKNIILDDDNVILECSFDLGTFDTFDEKTVFVNKVRNIVISKDHIISLRITKKDYMLAKVTKLALVENLMNEDKSEVDLFISFEITEDVIRNDDNEMDKEIYKLN